MNVKEIEILFDYFSNSCYLKLCLNIILDKWYYIFEYVILFFWLFLLNY